MSEKVAVYFHLHEGRDDDIIAFYRAIPRTYRGDVNKALVATLRAGIQAQGSDAVPPPQEMPEIKAMLLGLPGEIRAIIDAALDGATLAREDNAGDDDEDFTDGLLDNLTLD